MMPASVAALIAKNGVAVAIAGSLAGSYNVATSTPTNTSYAANALAVLLPINPLRLREGSVAAAGDEQLLLAPLDQAGGTLAKPPLDSVVTFPDGRKRTIFAVDELGPSGTNLLFDCLVRTHS